MAGVLLEERTGVFQRALATNDSQNNYLNSYTPTTAPPTFDGAFDAGGPGEICPRRIKVFPFAYGEPLGEFYVRVYGWSRLGNHEDPKRLWWTYLLVEMFCITCYQSGPPYSYLNPTEYFVDTISVTNGTLGMGYGSSPGNNLVGYAVLDLQGCQRFSFDFVTGEEYPAFGNALWAFAG